jgi:long-subunit fatty acid transport protein
MMQFNYSPTMGAEYNNSPAFSERSNRFGLASAGAVFVADRGTGALTNFNIGFVYNRIADFNQNSKFASFGRPATESMANFLCTQSNLDGLQTNADGTMPFGGDPYYWGAVLAYKNGLTNKDAEGWYIDRIGKDAIIDQYTALETRGSIGEYALTMGFNFVDKFYFGATLGIQSVNYKRNVFYGENYLYDEETVPSGSEMPYQLTYMNYMQATHLTGSGLNLKLGLTWRPIDWLRVGVAYHTPTFYSLSLRYEAEMWSETYSAGNNPEGYDIGSDGLFTDDVYSPLQEDTGEYSWNYRSPSRLLVGAAVTIAKRLIISADYERSWYQSMRLTNSPIWNLGNYGDVMKDMFRGSNTLRLGAELRLLPFMDLRAGYIYSDGGLRDNTLIYSHPLTTNENYVTAGVGFKFNNTVYLDLAYQYNNVKRTAYQSFYATNDSVQIESQPVVTDTFKHIAVLTLGIRF